MNQRGLRRLWLTEGAEEGGKLISCSSIPALHALSRLGCPEIQFWFLRGPPPTPYPTSLPGGVKGSPPRIPVGLSEAPGQLESQGGQEHPRPRGWARRGQRGLGDLPRVYLPHL